MIYISWDNVGEESTVVRGINRLLKAGFKPRQLRVLMFVNGEDDIDSARYRWTILRNIGCEPFGMFNKDNLTSRLRKIRRRTCRPAIWRNLTTEQVFE